MTLDISKFIANTIRTQAKIHHLDVNVKSVSKDAVPKSVVDLITKDYGDTYLDDANYVAFFWGGINKDNIDKLFNTVDKALGTSANKLTDKDFKKISMDGEPAIDASDEDDEEETEDIEDVEVDDEEPEEDDEEKPSFDNDDEDDDNDEDEDSEQLNEDEEEEEVDVEVKEEKPIPTAYFFLKITSK